MKSCDLVEAAPEMTLSGDISKGCSVLVDVCANLQDGEKALVICDDLTADVGRLVAAVAQTRTSHVALRLIPSLGFHGREPDQDTADEMSRSDVVFGLTWHSMAHTHARRAACSRGMRYLSLPYYSREVLERPSLQVDFRELSGVAEVLAQQLSRGSQIRLVTASGTKLTFGIQGRIGNACPGWCAGPGTLASPPDAEVNIAVVEDRTCGVAVVDGSIPCDEIGLLQNPLRLTIENGSVVDVQGDQAEVLCMLFERQQSAKARIVAEFGMGLNPLAELAGFMLEDEGCFGTVHLGMGSNATIGGKNTISFHLDHVMRRATVWVDDRMVFERGRLTEGVRCPAIPGGLISGSNELPNGNDSSATAPERTEDLIG